MSESQLNARPFGSVEGLPSGKYRARYQLPTGRRVNSPGTFDSAQEADAWLSAESLRQRPTLARKGRQSSAFAEQSLAASIAAGLNELLTVEETAQRLGTGVLHVRALIRTGRMTHVRIGRFMRIPASALAVFIEANTTVAQ